MLSEFPYGCSYSPMIFSEEAWEKDLANMQSASMNLVRIGDVHGSWDRIEPRPGELQLDRLNRFYEMANRYGISILLSTGASSPPLWLAHQHPDVVILSNTGERYPLGASYHWACIHHPAFREAAQKYTYHLASFAIQHPNHFGWQITNEIGFPFMPLHHADHIPLYCYCDHCQIRFRDWVREKYTSLDMLNEAWSWGTTNLVCNAWEEIFPPKSTPDSWSGVTRWIDWRLFFQDAFASFVGWQHETIRKIDTDHPTSVNTFNFKSFDRFGTLMGLDQWKIAQKTDHIGYDLYPGSGNKLASRPEHNSIFLDHGRSVSESVQRDFWIHEIESGPIGGWIMGPEYDTDEQDILNYVVECLGHNAKLLLYMPWREWHYQPLRWGALVDLDGNITPRLDSAAHIGKTIQEQADFLRNAHTSPAEALMIESKPNAIFFHGVDQEELLFKAQRGAYRAFWDLGFQVDFIDANLVSLDRLTRYKMVCLPMMGLLDDSLAEILERYVNHGGMLFGFARCGTLDQQGWYQHPLPLRSLANIFGIETLHAGIINGQSIQFENQTYQAHINRDIISIKDDTQVLAYFSDGLPAVSLHHSGKGAGIYLATQADSGNLDPKSSLLTDVVRTVSNQAGIVPIMGFDDPLPRAAGMDPHLLENGNKTMVLISNYATDQIATKFWMRMNGRRLKEARQLYPEQKLLHCVHSDNKLGIPINFKAKEVMILELTWE
jgi:beta-galactosidase